MTDVDELRSAITQLHAAVDRLIQARFRVVTGTSTGRAASAWPERAPATDTPGAQGAGDDLTLTADAAGHSGPQLGAA